MSARVRRPASLQELWPLLADGQRPMAGGTDLLAACRGRLGCDVALLEGIPDLMAVGAEGNNLRLGATASHASLLFFAISELAAIDPMYQYSLGWFLGLFGKAMVEAPKVGSGMAGGARKPALTRLV